MKVLVTGGAGFIGKYVCEELIEREHEVRCIDNFYRFDKNKIDDLLDNEKFEFVEGDIRNREKVSKALDDCKHVIHLAAQSNVKESLENKDYSFETNVNGTWILLREAEEHNIDRFIFASSREVYGDTEGKVSEDHELEPKNFYGVSKVSCELYLDQFEDYSDLDTYSLRLANVYGPGDKKRVIPKFLKKARKDEEIELYGGDQILDFVWIEDVVEAFVQVLEEGSDYRKINIGSGEDTSIRQLADAIKELTKSNSDVVEKEERDYDTSSFISDIERMKELDIKPLNLEKGLKKHFDQI